MGKSATKAKPAAATPPPETSAMDVKEITRRLAEPFEASEVKFKPAVVSGNRAMALAYVDARVIQDRLDDVLGVEGWQDNYKVLEDGSVVCRLRLRLGEQWVTKVDVGGPSEQGDSGDRRKAAFSDALKRAAVKFGIGRYLYRFPSQWVDYDSHRKQFAQQPKLPPFAIPKRKKEPTADQPTVVSSAPETKPSAKSANMPANGAELQRRLYDYDAKLAKEKLIAQGDLVRHVVEAGVKAGHEPDLATWTEEAIKLAAEVTKAFENQARARRQQREVA